MEQIKEYLINKIFTLPYIDRLIFEHSVPDSFLKCISRYVKNEKITYGQAISKIYQYMDDEYRNEYFYKNTILNELLIKKHDLYTTAALSELPIANSKADFVMINGKGIVYEIKTDLDSLVRLDNQIADYYKLFSYVYVVVGKKQLNKVKEHLEHSTVGIYELTKNQKLICRKKALYERTKLSYEAMFQVLRKHEFEYILLKHHGKLPEVNAFEYYRECFKWVKKINIITLQKEILSCLKQRTLLKIEDIDEDSIPYELRFYAYFSKKYRNDIARINNFLEKEVEV